MLKLLALFVGVVSQVSFAATTIISEDMTSVDDWNIAVAKGDIVEVAVAQTGAGKVIKTGEGTLKFTVANSTFTGGVEIQAGVVRVEADEALGTGTITILGQRDGYTGACCLDIVGGTVGSKVWTITRTLSNPIHVIGDSDRSYPAIRGYY